MEFAPQDLPEDPGVHERDRTESSWRSRSATFNESEHSGDYDFSGIFPDTAQKSIASETPLVDTPIMDELDAEHSFSRATTATVATVGELAKSALSAVFTKSLGVSAGESFGKQSRKNSGSAVESGRIPADLAVSGDFGVF